jgi:hypothetical protein
MQTSHRRGSGSRPVFSGVPRGMRASSILRACPKCDAAIGEKCKRWKMESGERIYVIAHLAGFHAERKSQ